MCQHGLTHLNIQVPTSGFPCPTDQVLMSDSKGFPQPETRLGSSWGLVLCSLHRVQLPAPNRENQTNQKVSSLVG